MAGEQEKGKTANPEEEINKYRKLLDKDPKSRAFAPLAEAYRKAGLLDEAIATARDGLNGNPGYFGGRVALGRALFEKGEFAEARGEFTQVVQAVPDNLMAHKLLGKIHLRLQNREEAEKSYRMVLLLDPRDEEAKKFVEGGEPPEIEPAPAPAGESAVAPEISPPAEALPPEEPAAGETGDVEEPYAEVSTEPAFDLADMEAATAEEEAAGDEPSVGEDDAFEIYTKEPSASPPGEPETGAPSEDPVGREEAIQIFEEEDLAGESDEPSVFDLAEEDMGPTLGSDESGSGQEPDLFGEGPAAEEPPSADEPAAFEEFPVAEEVTPAAGPEVSEEVEIVEEPPVFEEAPAVEEPPVVEEFAAFEEFPVAEEVTPAAEPEVSEEAEIVEEPPVFEEAPAVEEPPVVEEFAAFEEFPVAEEVTPAAEPEVSEEAETVEEPPVFEEAPAVEEPPVVEEFAAFEEFPVAEEVTPAAGPEVSEEAEIVEEPPVFEEAPAVEEPPVVEEFAAFEEFPVAEEVTPAAEPEVTEEAAIIETPPEFEEVEPVGELDLEALTDFEEAPVAVEEVQAVAAEEVAAAAGPEEGIATVELTEEVDEGPAADEGGVFDTETLADLYINQGFYGKAADVYRRILQDSPEDNRLKQKLEEVLALEKMEGSGAAVLPDEAAVQPFETPPEPVAVPAAEPPAAAGELSAPPVSGEGENPTIRELRRLLVKLKERPGEL